MRTVVTGPTDGELAALIERRRATGADLFDEVWEGDYHMAPAPHPAHGQLDQQLAELLGPPARARGLVGTGPFNLGTPDDYRVPDRGIHREAPSATFVRTAALVIEIVSPDDESWAKLVFFAARDVDEVLIVDPSTRSVTWLARTGDTYEPVARSEVLALEVDELRNALEWPGGAGT
ncbi:MAG: Uma2 family endonuclease [Iamia sp.]